MSTTTNQVAITFGPVAVRSYFGGRLMGQQLGSNIYEPVIQDRLGSVGKYYPYGEERNSPQLPNDQVKFATYTRDSATGNDYADQRYYTSTLGRFMTPDPYGGSAMTNNPTSWNRYGYVNGDPVNSSDPTGEDLVPLCTVGTGEGAELVPCETVSRSAPQPLNPTPTQEAWDSLSAECQKGLEDAMPGPDTPVNMAKRLAALNRATAAESTLQAATAGTNIDWTMLGGDWRQGESV